MSWPSSQLHSPHDAVQDQWLPCTWFLPPSLHESLLALSEGLPVQVALVVATVEPLRHVQELQPSAQVQTSPSLKTRSVVTQADSLPQALSSVSPSANAKHARYAKELRRARRSS